MLIPLMPQVLARVADVGCGTGSLAVLFAEAGYPVSGLDVAPAMVKRARAKAAEAGVEAEFVVADAMKPPWPQGTFDAVPARHVLWALPDARLGLERWLELLCLTVDRELGAGQRVGAGVRVKKRPSLKCSIDGAGG